MTEDTNEALVTLIQTSCDLANSIRDDLLDDEKISEETKYLLKKFRDHYEKVHVLLEADDQGPGRLQ